MCSICFLHRFHKTDVVFVIGLFGLVLVRILYTTVYIYIYICICICTYIYRERERESEIYTNISGGNVDIHREGERQGEREGEKTREGEREATL